MPKNFGPATTTWGNASQTLLEKIETAVESRDGLTLTPAEVDRLGGVLWQLGVFHK